VSNASASYEGRERRREKETVEQKKQGEGNNGDKETKDKMIHGILVVLSIFIFSNKK
jgi:hypothetical protein